VSDLVALATTIAAADTVVTIGGGTQRDVGGRIDPGATEVRVPGGVVSYEPADMTVTVLAGTPVAALDAVLAEHGQECPLDPRSTSATVGGVLACGLSGPRRLRYGPLRDRILEVRFVTGDGRIVKGGGPTVKNVTGYDLPRLFVGSLGTLGVITHVTLRTQPRAECSQWAQTDAAPDALRDRLFRPATLAWNGRRTFVRLEGYAEDVAAQQRHANLGALPEPPNWPAGPHRGRISIAPGRLGALARLLDRQECEWLAEGMVGTVHVAAATEDGLAAARGAAEATGGWLLREAGAPGLDPFGRTPPNLPLLVRIKEGFDPAGKLNPGRLPFLRSAA
jgi:glycolate dehydrogenase FAD-binding subunit